MAKASEQARPPRAPDWVEEHDLIAEETVADDDFERATIDIGAARRPMTSAPEITVSPMLTGEHPLFDDDSDFEDLTTVKDRSQYPLDELLGPGHGSIPPPNPGALASERLNYGSLPPPRPPPADASGPHGAIRDVAELTPDLLISGKYRLTRLLGKGGMGSVWAARNQLTDRDFAIKFLLTDLSQNKEALHRFFLEARACGQIKHPAIVDVYDMGEAEDGSPYLVMELLEGEGFDARLAREKRFSPGEAAAWIAFVARGLEEAHVRSLVHRDLKPGNIFFARDDRGDVLPKVLDFGVSKAVGPSKNEFVKTTTGAVLGSPAYMSPEQASGEPDIDARSDVWSLGVILYEAITGQVPFDAANYNALMLTIITKDHKPALELDPTLPPELSALVDQALAKDRGRRIATARELAERLEAIAATLGASMPALAAKARNEITSPAFARPFSTTEGSWTGQRRAQKKGNLVLMGGVVAAAAAVVASLVFWQTRPPMVALAGRESAMLASGLAHLKTEMDQMKSEAKAKEAEEKKPPAVELSDLPNAKTHPTSAPASNGKAPRPPSTAPRGSHGVDGPGF